METYSIAQVEAITGIQAPTLRMWEKRYGFIVPSRTDTKIRYYTDDQLKTLINVSVLLDAGHKISKLAKMEAESLQNASLDIQTNSASNTSDIKALVISMLEFDEARFEEIFQISVIRRGLLDTMISVIYPFLHQVGILWGADKVMPAQEHFISNLVRRKLFTAIDGISTPAKKSKKAVLFLPEQEEHEIALLMACFVLKNAGWQTFYLGTNVPLENILTLEKMVKPDVLVTFLISPSNEPLKKFNTLVTHVQTHVLISGNPNHIPVGTSGNFSHLRHPNDLLNYIRNH